MQGGGNAGHTIFDDKGVKYALHLVPSGILNKDATNVVGNGVVVHVPGLFEELDGLKGLREELLWVAHVAQLKNNSRGHNHCSTR